MNLTYRRALKSGLGHHAGHRVDGDVSDSLLPEYLRWGEDSSIEKEGRTEMGEERVTCLKTVFELGIDEIGEGMFLLVEVLEDVLFPICVDDARAMMIREPKLCKLEAGCAVAKRSLVIRVLIAHGTGERLLRMLMQGILEILGEETKSKRAYLSGLGDAHAIP